MAQYEHLPIYKKAYDLTLYFDEIVRNFSRYHKYESGKELRELSRDVVRLIRRANDATTERPQILLQARERLEDLKMAIRLCKDLKAFANLNSYRGKSAGVAWAANFNNGKCNTNNVANNNNYVRAVRVPVGK